MKYNQSRTQALKKASPNKFNNIYSLIYTQSHYVPWIPNINIFRALKQYLTMLIQRCKVYDVTINFIKGRMFHNHIVIIDMVNL